MNPLLSREIRERFRDGRAFVPVFFLSAGLSLLFAWLFAANTNANPAQSTLSGRAIFSQLAWTQTLLWLLLAPALTSSSIAYERERGWFDSLLLSPLLPRQIALGKWGAALLYAVLLGCITWPFLALTFLLGGVSLRQFFLILVLHAACALCGSAIGLAASAWSPRASSALRTAYGLIFCGLAASFFGAAAAGELPFRFIAVPGKNLFFTYFGRTNPILRAVEISGDLEFQRVGICLAFLGALTLFFLGVATYYARRALPEAPFIERKPQKSANSTKNEKARPTHGKIPLASRLHFANPVLDREVRAKFRLRQPPLAVIISEIVLGILVAFFYARTLYWAFFEAQYRLLIWWGIGLTALLISLMAAAIMGGNALSREREGGTWEGVQLSLLSPDEILRGKVFASLITCAIFSLPVWPLMLPCIAWNAGFGVVARGTISPVSALSCLAIWAATVWSYTLIGLWIGRKAPRTARASGQTLGILSAFLLIWPFLISVAARINWEIPDTIAALPHPFIAFFATEKTDLATISQIVAPYCAFHLGFGIVMWFVLRAFLKQEIAPATKNEATRKTQSESA